MDCIELCRQNSLRVARRCIGANKVAAAPRSHPVGAYGGPEAAASKLYFIASVAAFRQRGVRAVFRREVMLPRVSAIAAPRNSRASPLKTYSSQVLRSVAR